ncbi:hypothetical protein J4461_01845 [Candidatus Pacearchaeota archaeon]|nr:hypothetical protein [Candidatus Pacearchaeota archaeon]
MRANTFLVVMLASCILLLSGIRADAYGSLFVDNDIIVGDNDSEETSMETGVEVDFDAEATSNLKEDESNSERIYLIGGSNKTKTLLIGNIEATTELDIEVEPFNGSTSVVVSLNSKKVKVINPEEAYITGKSALNASCERGCSIELKLENKNDLLYVFYNNKGVVLLKFMPLTISEKAIINAESGVVIDVKKPWWMRFSS